MFQDFRYVFVRFFLLASMMLASAAVAANQTGARNVLVVGDSLSAAYGIPREQGWVALLQQQLDREMQGFHVINASISGETTSGGLSRMERLLAQHRPRLVILELGANDGLRGLPVSDMRRNLAAMIELSQKSGAKVALIGNMIPPNYGPRYAQEFRESYAQLARQYELPLVPFLLDGVTEDPDLMQEDGLHPNARAQPLLLQNVWRALAPWFRRNAA
ncbi:MAG TPA: arylesterase [Methylophilaceae bacterium]|jgi:acyl-CoA thioesterase-1